MYLFSLSGLLCGMVAVGIRTCEQGALHAPFAPAARVPSTPRPPGSPSLRAWPALLLRRRCRWRESGAREASAIVRPGTRARVCTHLHTTGRVALHSLWHPRYRSMAQPVKLSLAPSVAEVYLPIGARQRAMHREGRTTMGRDPLPEVQRRRLRSMPRRPAPSPTVVLLACRAQLLRAVRGERAGSRDR